MRLLSKTSRENKGAKPTLLGAETVRVETVQHSIESTQAIGQRYETIHGGLDSIGRVMEHLKAIEPLIAEIRGPVSQEFEARRAEHAELIALRANFDQAQRQIAQIQAEEREASARLAAAETALGESEARRQAQDTALEDNTLEIDRLRNALLQSELKVSNVDAALRDANARIEHLVQDVEGLRAQAQDIDARRGEAEAALARYGRLVAKPAADGSSYGLIFVDGPADLERLKAAAATEAYVIEPFVAGQEATCGVLERADGSLIALPPVEILPAEGVFDYQAKYLSAGTRELCPSTFSPEIVAALGENALKAHRAVGAAGYSRSDFIITAQGPVFLEINTLPGMTASSLYPKSLKAEGIGFEDFLRGQIALAEARARKAVAA